MRQDWRRPDYPICIAAACQVGTSYPVIVGCTDWRASSEVEKNDRYPKARHLRPGWISLSAGMGSEITSFHRPLLAAMKAAETVDETNIVGILQSALRERKNQKANEYVGMKFGISYQDFVEKGWERFPPDVFRDNMAAISGLPILAETIVCGFCDGVPLICKTDQAGRVSIRDHFAVIGEGEHLAAMALNHREHSDSDGLERTLYNVFGAKNTPKELLA
jgi:hypothetical protein